MFEQGMVNSSSRDNSEGEDSDEGPGFAAILQSSVEKPRERDPFENSEEDSAEYEDKVSSAGFSDIFRENDHGRERRTAVRDESFNAGHNSHKVGLSKLMSKS